MSPKGGKWLTGQQVISKIIFWFITTFTHNYLLLTCRLNYRIQGHLFTSHWITKVPIVLCFVLEKILTHVKQVVWSGPAFCSCSEESSTALGFSNAEDVEEWAPWSTEINGKTSAKQLMFGQKPVQTNEGDHEAPMKEESSTALGFSNAEDVEEWAPWSSLRARVPSRH